MSVPHSRLVLSVTAALALATGAAVVTTPAVAAAPGCSISYSVVSEWPGQFQANVSVTNLGDRVTSWALTWSFPGGQVVSQSWGGVVTQSGTQVTAQNAPWNGVLATNGSATVGFIASRTGAGNPIPLSFALNGTACTGGPTPPPPPPPDALTRVQTVGRVKTDGAALQYTWPGIYFEGRFHGTGVGIALNDGNNDYDVQIDGATVAKLVTPGQTTYWVSNLSNADHTVRLVKRTEIPWAAGQFGGFIAAPGGTILAKPAARRRQIEFIGDSFTAGYGNTSGQRDCAGIGGVDRNSDADLSFGAHTAKSLNADYQLIAESGLGMVRNFGGSNPTFDFRTFYDRALQNVDGDVWVKPASWAPQLVVVGLGINDFSTSLNANEKWATTDSLVADYTTAYQGFIDKLRARYGRDAIIVVSATLLSNTTLFADTAQRIVAARNSQGDNRIAFWYYDDPNLDRLGCDFHPSVHDDNIISGLLDNFIATLPLNW
jgi:lysophospholipase L1-like esterase